MSCKVIHFETITIDINMLSGSSVLIENHDKTWSIY